MMKCFQVQRPTANLSRRLQHLHRKSQTLRHTEAKEKSWRLYLGVYRSTTWSLRQVNGTAFVIVRAPTCASLERTTPTTREWPPNAAPMTSASTSSIRHPALGPTRPAFEEPSLSVWLYLLFFFILNFDEAVEWKIKVISQYRVLLGEKLTIWN